MQSFDSHSRDGQLLHVSGMPDNYQLSKALIFEMDMIENMKYLQHKL
jgi:hypothetical protein